MFAFHGNLKIEIEWRDISDCCYRGNLTWGQIAYASGDSLLNVLLQIPVKEKNAKKSHIRAVPEKKKMVRVRRGSRNSSFYHDVPERILFWMRFLFSRVIHSPVIFRFSSIMLRDVIFIPNSLNVQSLFFDRFLFLGKKAKPDATVVVINVLNCVNYWTCGKGIL